MSKFAGFIIGTLLIVAGVLTGNPYLIIQGATMIVTQAIVDLTAPKTPARQASEMSIQLGEQPRSMQIGETATAGSLVDGFNYGGKYGTDWEYLIIRLADHKCASLTGFYVNDEYNAYTGDGPQSRYKDQLVIYFRSDTTNQALPSVVTTNGPGWTSADIGESGCDVIIGYKADKPDAKHPVWPGGRPRFLFVIKGALCYDPRLDDTVDGGSGDHRWEDPDTWEWSENAVICWYKFQRGVYANDDTSDQSKLLVGRGLSAEESPPENVFAAANLCDEIAASIFPTRSADSGGSLANLAYSPDKTRIYAASSNNILIYDVRSQTLLLNKDTGISFGNPVACSSTTLYGYDSGDLYSATLDGGGWTLLGNVGVVAGYVGAQVFENSLGEDVVYITGGAGAQPTYYDGSFHVSGTSRGDLNYVRDLDGNVWAYGNHSGDFYVDCLTGARVGETYIIAGLGTLYLIANPNGDFCAIGSSDRYILANADFSVISTVSSGLTVTPAAVMQMSPGSTSLWCSNQEISTTSLAVLRTVDLSDFLPGATIENAKVYDPVNNALIVHPTAGADAGWYWLFLDRNGGYRVAGPVYSNQEFLEVEEMFASATGGNIVTREGAVLLEPGQAKSVVASFSDTDILSGSQVNWNQGFLSDSNAEWVNTIVARYVEPDQKWNDHAAPVLRDTADIVDDGKPIEASITLRLVRYQAQALRIGEINRRLGRIWGRGTVKLGPRFCELEEGDWVQWQSDRYFGGGTKTFRIDAYAIDEKWQVSLTLREINGSVYADDAVFDSDQSAPSSPPPILPEVGAPDSGDWTLTATTLDSSGASVPVLEITGAVPTDENAQTVIVEYWKSDGVSDPIADPDSVAWTSAGRYTPDTAKIDITSLTGGEDYYVAISYVVSGITGERLVLGPETVADLDVSGQAPPKLLPIVPETGTTYTLAATDFNKHLRFTNAAGCTVTVPKNATAAYPVGGRTRMTAAGAGDVVLAPEDGTVTLNSRDAALISGGQMAVLEVEKVATNEWDVLGDVTT